MRVAVMRGGPVSGRGARGAGRGGGQGRGGVRAAHLGGDGEHGKFLVHTVSCVRNHTQTLMCVLSFPTARLSL